MKALNLLLFIALTAVACNKANTINPLTLRGKWKLVQVYSSNGSNGQWQAVPGKANYDYVQFGPGGKLTGTTYSAYQNYTVTDSVTLTFYAADTLEHYRYSVRDGTLTLNPSRPVFCIEGCGNKFIKVSN